MSTRNPFFALFGKNRGTMGIKRYAYLSKWTLQTWPFCKIGGPLGKAYIAFRERKKNVLPEKNGPIGAYIYGKLISGRVSWPLHGNEICIYWTKTTFGRNKFVF